MSISTDATSMFNVPKDGTTVELIALKEYETSSFKLGSTTLYPAEVTLIDIHYEAVFEKIQHSAMDAIVHYRKEVSKDEPVAVRVTHRMSQLVNAVEDKYVACVSVCAYTPVKEAAPDYGGRISFGDALYWLKEGKKVARAGWNGKGMWLKLIGFSDKHTAYDVVGDEELHALDAMLPWIGMKTADNCFVPWLASQTDILASDWVVVS